MSKGQGVEGPQCFLFLFFAVLKLRGVNCGVWGKALKNVVPHPVVSRVSLRAKMNLLKRCMVRWMVRQEEKIFCVALKSEDRYQKIVTEQVGFSLASVLGEV